MQDFPSWLKPTRAALEGLMERDQFPHGIMIHGPAGCGRRLLALWIATRALAMKDVDLSAGLANGRLLDLEAVPQHADLRLIQLAEDKRDIPVEPVRGLIDFLNLTSHQGATKVAMITPAETMNAHAANSLLKTLEEPPGQCLILLVTESLSRLPATLASRCHRVRISVPSEAAAMAWLEEADPAVDWRPVLELAGGAPVSALQLQQTGFPKQAAVYAKDLGALRKGATTPVEVAARWARTDQDLCLRWLYLRIGREIREVNRNLDTEIEPDFQNGSLREGTRSLSLERSFEYLSEINDLRRRQGAGLNVSLQLTSLLTRWCGDPGS